LPVPLLPAVMVIQLFVVLAVQAQLLPAVTLTEPLPPFAEYEALLDDRPYVQALLVCVTV
jgi:hypothetical protein